MIIYRIANKEYASDLSGTGAKMYGGRWNPEGLPVLYAATHRSLAALEIIVNSDNALMIRNMVMISIDVPDELSFKIFSIKELPPIWRQNPAPVFLQQMGKLWLESMESLVLKVPSVVIPREYNVLINPMHQDFAKVKIIERENFELDRRIAH